MPLPKTPTDDKSLQDDQLDLDSQGLASHEAELAQEIGGYAEKDDFDALNGIWLGYRRTFTGKHYGTKKEKAMKNLLQKKDLYEIHVSQRGEVYRYWEKRVLAIVLKQVKDHMKEYRETVEMFQITKVGDFVQFLILP